MLSDAEHMRWYPAPFDREAATAWLERTLRSYETRGFGLLIVEERATGEFVGTAGLTIQVVEDVDEVEIGWHTRPGRKGEGIAPEAAGALRDRAFEAWTSTT
jgi:RimJ/RimL family protein N-acetyltransferase